MMGPKPPLLAVATSTTTTTTTHGHLPVLVVVVVLTVLGTSQPVAGAVNWMSFLTGGSCGVAKDKFQDDYDAFNNLLVNRVATESPLDNLVEAVRWSKQLVDGLAMSDEERREIQSLRLKPMIQFTSLLKLMDIDNIECGPLSYDTLKRNELATGAKLMLPEDSLGPLRRIDSVIRQVAVWHAQQCRYIYPKLLKWAQKDAAKQSLEDIRRMWNGIIETSRKRIFLNEAREMDNRQLLREKAGGISLTGHEEAQAMLVYLRNRARNDPDVKYLSRLSDPKRRGKWMVVVPKVAELLNKYAFAVCEYLIRAFGHILRPAAYEQQLSSHEHRYRAVNNDNAELIIQMEYFRLCDDLLNKHKSTMQKNVVQAIWDEVR